MVIFTQFVEHKTLSLSWSKMKSKFCVAVAATACNSNQLRIIHSARQRRHFHFTYDFKVSAIHAFHFTCRKMIANSFILPDKNAFSFHSQSVWCAQNSRTHTKNRHMHMHACINNTHIYVYQQTRFKCAQFHWRNVNREILSYLCCDCFRVHEVSKRVFCVEFWDIRLTFHYDSDAVKFIRSWARYCDPFSIITIIWAVISPWCCLLVWLGLRDYDIVWAFKLSAMGKKKEKHKKNENTQLLKKEIWKKNKQIIKWKSEMHMPRNNWETYFINFLRWNLWHFYWFKTLE